MTILITGFGPFDGGSNASERLVRALAERRAALGSLVGAPVETLILPVDTENAGGLLAETAGRLQPTHLLLTGQAAGRSKLSFERIATNRRDFRVPDSAGRTISGSAVLDDGPAHYRSTWPDLEGIVAALDAAGIPAEMSDECGTHLCNQMLYLALHGAAPSSAATVFLHVPLVPEQVSAGEPAALRHPGCPSLPLDVVVRAVELTLVRTAKLEAAA